MRDLFLSTTLFATIVTAMFFGVLLGYTVILVILRMFGHRPKTQVSTATTKLATPTALSGD